MTIEDTRDQLEDADIIGTAYECPECDDEWLYVAAYENADPACARCGGELEELDELEDDN